MVRETVYLINLIGLMDKQFTGKMEGKMTFHVKQWLFHFLFTGGGLLAGAVTGMYISEDISLTLFVVLGLMGCLMVIGACIFAHFCMHCKSCHKLYPLSGWLGMECCPYCGEYFDI